MYNLFALLLKQNNNNKPNVLNFKFLEGVGGSVIFQV